MKNAVRARVKCARLNPSDVEGAKRGCGEIADRLLPAIEPATIGAAAKLRLQAIIVEDDKTTVLGQLHIELGSVTAGAGGLGEGVQRILGPKPCAAAVSNVEKLCHCHRDRFPRQKAKKHTILACAHRFV